MKTLYLDPTAWDLTLDISGNVAVASVPYSIAQDVASSVRTFLGECWYDTSRGIPYLSKILGQSPPLAYIKAQIAAAAQLVPGCIGPVVFIASIKGRVLTGQVQFTEASGQSQVVAFGPTPGQLYDTGGNPLVDSNGNPIIGST